MKQHLHLIVDMTVDLDRIGSIDEFSEALRAHAVSSLSELYRPNGGAAYPCSDVEVIDVEWGEQV